MKRITERDNTINLFNQKIEGLHNLSRLELLERFYELETQKGWTAEEAIEWDALKIVLKYTASDLVGATNKAE